MDQDPSRTGQQQQGQQAPVSYDISVGGHYGKLPPMYSLLYQQMCPSAVDHGLGVHEIRARVLTRTSADNDHDLRSKCLGTYDLTLDLEIIVVRP